MKDKDTLKKLPCSRITDVIISAYYKTLDTLGTVRGTPERVFRSEIAARISEAGLRVEIGKVIEVRAYGKVIDTATIDIVVDGLVVVCIKKVLKLTTLHFAKGTYHMEVGGYPVGLLLNYGDKERKPRRLTPPRHYRKGPWPCPSSN